MSDNELKIDLETPSNEVVVDEKAETVVAAEKAAAEKAAAEAASEKAAAEKAAAEKDAAEAAAKKAVEVAVAVAPVDVTDAEAAQRHQSNMLRHMQRRR